MTAVRRGWDPDDPRRFNEKEIEKLSLCAYEAAFLMERGYPAQSAVTFTSNHRLLTARQRNALGRMTAPPSRLRLRKSRELAALEPGCTVSIDTFNAVILMETALSNSMVLRCMDGCIRDLSGLSGTYRIIDVTDPAIDMILKKLIALGAGKAVFYLDSPVSNSGRLKTHIAERAEALHFPIDLIMVHNADRSLMELDHVITADSEIIENCRSWFNLYPYLIDELESPWVVELKPQ